jgi:acid phosphatase type 7
VKMDAPSFRRVTVRGVDAHRVYTVKLTGLVAGKELEYRVSVASTPVFTAHAHARKSAAQPYKFVVFGDCAQGTDGQRQVAYQTSLAKPDFVLIAGDIVYSRGLASEYLTKYFPIYNADEPSASAGAPLLRSTVFIGAPGNHDISIPDVTKYPDALAFYYYWNQPLNGPPRMQTIGAPSTPVLIGAEEDRKAFLAAAGPAFPGMANFSFDYGNAHWTVLDSNKNVDWTDPALIKWLTDDLKAAQAATWRFIAFHHPGFNSSTSHFKDQWMRGLSEVFEKGNVSVVFAGHVHNYQRTFPLTFQTKPDGFDKTTGVLDGSWTLDKQYDGKTKTKPNGIIYLVTGGGGAKLYNPEQETKPETWQPFTTKFIASTNSFTLVDVKDKQLTIRQVAANGDEVDRFVITK